MIFPQRERVIYHKNPLAQVTCQLRFPTILTIDEGEPAAFQERIRDDYPDYTVQPVSVFPQGLPPEVIKHIFAHVSPFSGNTTYQFLSKNGQWAIHLSRNHISLSTSAYQRWEEFEERLFTLIAAAAEEYRPSFFNRIGLRYQNLIHRTRLELNEVGWDELLQPYIGSALSWSEAERDVEESYTQVVFRLKVFDARVRLVHGLAPENATGETCYMIDSDFFSQERSDTNNAIKGLQFFNQCAGNLFRWCITDRLHTAMDPWPL